MSELRKNLDQLALRLDQMGLRVERAVMDSIRAVREGDIELGRQIDAGDGVIDREEVEIQQECVRLLALFQPAAVDLRTIFAIIQINSDLERIGDIAARVGRRVKYAVAQRVNLDQYPGLTQLAELVTSLLGKTVRLLTNADADAARSVIAADIQIDQAYQRVMQAALGGERTPEGGLEVAMTLVLLARALERIGDHCTNIAEDVVFLRTGDILRHAAAQQQEATGPGTSER